VEAWLGSVRRQWRLIGSAFAILAISSAASQVSAQALPDTVKVINTFAPGGAADTALRILVQWIGENGGPRMVVENRPGGASAIGLNAVKTSPPDGSTIGVCDSGALAANMWLFKQLSYDPQKDFAPITTYVNVPIALAVPSSLPAASMAELIKLGRERTQELSYGSQAIGASGHLLGAYLGKVGSIKTVHVPFRGAGPAVNELVAGRIDYLWTSFPSLKGFYETGKIKILAIGSPQRDAAFPDVPTTREQGFPQFEIEFWFGLCAPAGTPAAVVNELHARFAKALRSEAVLRQYAPLGMQPHSTTPEEFKALIAKDTVRLRDVVDSTGAKLD
jgi:tripartite-type tricarboxylate transporter receptor subunit TctC